MAIQSWQESLLPGDGYGDSWDPRKNYLSVGFYPGQALQSRELLELQTIALYQISATNRSLFKHGQPRIDLEEELLTDSRSPITRNGNNFFIKEYSQFFTNFSLSATSPTIPNGFWITFPPTTSALRETHTLTSGQYLGFEILRTTVDHEDDQTLYDPAGSDYANSNAPGATRFAFSIKNQNQGDAENPIYLTTKTNKREQGSFFVPLVYCIGTAYYWAFDETTQIPTS